MTFCTYHCRSCAAHFTSLEAFDAHRQDAECVYPDEAPLVELVGECRIGNPDRPKRGLAVLSLVRRGKFALIAREAAEGKASGHVDDDRRAA